MSNEAPQEEFDMKSIMAEVEPEESKTEEKVGEEKPLPHDEGWTDYILSFLNENEIYITDSGTKHPTVAGLRRVVTRFYDIISSTSKVHSVFVAYQDDRYPTATVEHSLRVKPRDEKNGIISDWSGCGTAGPWNGGKDSFPYPTECAETKAKGRAYVNLLGLKTCTKDEITGLTTKSSDKITGAQIKKYETFCKTLSISGAKFAALAFDGKYKKIEDYSSADFWKMWDYLNKLQQNMHNKTLTEKEKKILESAKD